MKKIPYFPGCTLNTTAKGFDLSARASMQALDIELVEIPKWNCCGTVYSLSTDDLMHQVAPIRILVRAQAYSRELGTEPSLATLCSMCFQTVKRANDLVKNDQKKIEKINNFMDTEDDYLGEVQVVHLLEMIKNMDSEAIHTRVKKSLNGLKAAPYYGCLLLRPKEIAIDDVEMPTVMEDLLETLGCKSVYIPYLTECCGSYHIVNHPETVADCTGKIIDSAINREADAIVTSCPLCHFNLDEKGNRLPIFYFTQLLAIALGLDPEICRFDLHNINPRPLLQEKNII